jgi:outer membrane receptor protein involved in Fe transport
MPRFNIVMGGGYYDVTGSTSSERHGNGYLYSYIRYPDQITWTLGISFDSLDDERVGKFDPVNPKLGMIWNLTPNTTLRLAVFRTLKRTLIANQTIEPTQVAGFNQFFDDFNGTESRRYGIALDQKFSPNLYGGLEVSRRELREPVLRVGTEILDQEEDLYRAYLDWIPHSNIAISWEYQMERFNSEGQFTGTPNTRTDIVPFTFRYFHPSGLLGRVSTTYIDQEVDFEPVGSPETRDDQFALVDVGIGYRLPRRYGIISFEVRNLFDEDFKFQGLGFRDPMEEKQTPPFLPERTVFARIILAF